MGYEDFASANEGELSARVREAVRSRLFALAFWQEASRAERALASRGVTLRFEPLAIDGFSLGYRGREVWVTREPAHVAVTVQGAAGLFAPAVAPRHEPPETPADMQKAAELVMRQVIAFLLERGAF
ncbi:MAG: hypothetical protein HYZ29_23325 [Myxococcales bacterium]|nr:hypothetical protein [Myxococcales bacterium]